MRNNQENNLQPHDVKEYTHEMPYKGGARGAETPSTGYIAGTHAHITDKARKDQLKDIGLETREEYIDSDVEPAEAEKEIRMQRIKRNCFIFVAMLILAMLTGMLIANFYGWSILIGLGIGAAVMLVIFMLLMIVYLVTNILKN